MKKALNTPRVTQAMDKAGLSPSALAAKLDVTKEAVSQGLKAAQGPGYVQTVMDMPLLDARGIHEALI